MNTFSNFVTVMWLVCALFFIRTVSYATVRLSVAQLRPRQPQTQIAAPLASTFPSTSAPSSSACGMTLEAIMAQFMCMDASLNTLSDKLCQVNTRVGCIARRQALMGGFIVASSPSPPTSKDKSDDGSSSDDADEDDGASSPSDDKMST